jgi:hypothetical protein
MTLPSLAFGIILLIAVSIPWLSFAALKAAGIYEMPDGLRATLGCVLITQTYLGFVVGEVFCPRSGGRRDPFGMWNPLAPYVSVVAAMSGACLGLALVASLFEPSWIPLMVASSFIGFHIVVRRLLTEEKGTPHLGQRGSKSEKQLETAIGMIGDAALAMVLVWLWFVTRQPLWIAGCVVFVCCYIVGVTVHRHLDPIQRSHTSYGLLLMVHAGVAGLVVALSVLGEITTQAFYNVVAGAALIVAAFTVVKRSGSSALVVVFAIVSIACVVGTLTVGAIDTRPMAMPLNPNVSVVQLARYLALIGFISAASVFLLLAATVRDAPKK